MNVLICGSRGVPPQYGGFESLAQGLATHLPAHGLKVFVTGFKQEVTEPILREEFGVVSYQVHARGPHFLQNVLSTWIATKDLDREYNFDAVLVLNDVNYFVARKYWNMSSHVLLHLDGSEAKRSGLPIIGKSAHWLFRFLSIKSKIPLVVDSWAIKNELDPDSRKINVISYAPHLDAPIKPHFEGIEIMSGEFLFVIARFVPENQIIEIMKAYMLSGRTEKMVIVGLGTGKKKYSKQILKIAEKKNSIYILPKNYKRAEINWLLQNAKAYIHGHSVGGTNPILIDARLHSQLILSHDNRYNKENASSKEFNWVDTDSLSLLLRRIEALTIDAKATKGYHLDSWESIANQYLKLLSDRT